MSDRDVVVFLLALAILLGAARLLGELGRVVGLPRVVGEIASGILLGPTVFGRIAPRAETWLFALGPGETMVRGYGTVALVLLLVVVGKKVSRGLQEERPFTLLDFFKVHVSKMARQTGDAVWRNPSGLHQLLQTDEKRVAGEGGKGGVG